MPLYEQSFVTVLKNARERRNAAIRAFRLHGDISRLMAEIEPIYRQVLTFGSYMLGHLAGRGNNLSIAAEMSGANIQRKTDGTIYINVPFTPETMPQ